MTTTTFTLPYGKYTLIASPGEGPFTFSANCDIIHLKSTIGVPAASKEGILLTNGQKAIEDAVLSKDQYLWVKFNGNTTSGQTPTLTVTSAIDVVEDLPTVSTISPGDTTPNPGSANAGLMRWSSTIGGFVIWDGTAWQAEPFEPYLFVPDTPSDAAILLRVPVLRSVTFLADFAGSSVVAGTAATGSSVITVTKIVSGSPTNIGTATFDADATVATLATTDNASQTLASGNVLLITAPATADATLADIGIALLGYRGV